MIFELRVSDIHDMQQDITFPYLIERTFKTLNKVVRQFPDKTDGIG